MCGADCVALSLSKLLYHRFKQATTSCRSYSVALMAPYHDFESWLKKEALIGGDNGRIGCVTRRRLLTVHQLESIRSWSFEPAGFKANHQSSFATNLLRSLPLLSPGSAPIGLAEPHTGGSGANAALISELDPQTISACNSSWQSHELSRFTLCAILVFCH